MWLTIRGYVAGVVAFVACPCHLPITLPLLLSLTAGTGLGAWLADNTITVGAISTGLFVAGLVLAFKWIGETGIIGNMKITDGQAKTPSAYDFEATSADGVPCVTLLTSSKCASCQQAKAIWQQAREQALFQFETVDIFSERGRDLAAKHHVFGTPAAIVNDALILKGITNMESILAALGSSPQTKHRLV